MWMLGYTVDQCWALAVYGSNGGYYKGAVGRFVMGDIICRYLILVAESEESLHDRIVKCKRGIEKKRLEDEHREDESNDWLYQNRWDSVFTKGVGNISFRVLV